MTVTYAKTEIKDMDEQDKLTEAGLFTAAGAGLGAASSALLGGIGVAVGGTAFAVGMAPLAAAGAVVGLAGWGLKKVLDKK